MSTRRTPVRTIIIGVVLAAAIAILVTRRSKPDEPPPEPEQTAEPEPEEEEEPAPRAERAPEPEPTPRAPEPVAEEEPPTREPTPEPAPPAAASEPFSPAMREHAILMITPVAKTAMEGGDLMQLRAIRDMVKERKADNLMGQSDIEALDLAIGCLERSPEAREEASDLIDFGTPTVFGDSFKKACGR